MKKAQFYIISAVILLTISLVIFALSSKSYPAKKKVDDFSNLHENYAREVSEVINNMIKEKNDNLLSELNVSNLEDYTGKFLDYARSRQTSFGLVYVFTYHNSSTVSNHLNEDVIFESESNHTVQSGSTLNLISTEKYNLYFNDAKYSFSKDGDTDFDAVYASADGQEVRVFVQQ